MKKFRKSLCVVLCVIILVMSFLAEASYAVESDVDYYLESGVLYVGGDGPMTARYSDDASIEEVYIERGVTSIPVGAFSGCENLRKVTMSNSVVSIGEGVFEDCTSLSEIRLSDKITAIPDFVFSNCSSLTGIKLPTSCEWVDYRAFGSCSALRFVIIPAFMSYMDSNAFYKCTSLENIYYAGSETDWENVDFTGKFSGNLTFLAPEFYFEKTFTSGRMALSLKLESGGFSALDVQLAPQGDCDIYRIQANRGYISSSSRNNGTVSMYSDESMAPGDEIVKVTYNVRNCENYSVNVSFISSTVSVEGYDIDVPVSNESFIVEGGHSLSSEWTVSADPSAEGDGTASASCECCGDITKNLPYVFKNCTEENGIAFISEYGLSADDFRTDYLTSDMPALTASSDYVGTGSAVSADYSDGIVYNYTVSLRGDADCDGFCDAQDSMIIACICEGMLSYDSLDLCTAFAADCNDDGSVDSADCEYACLNGVMALGD